MKTRLRSNPALPRQRAMTLVEMMVNTGLFVLVVGALVSVNLFGEKEDQYTNSALGASDEARNNFNLLLDDIRSGKNVQIGSGSYSNFVPVTNGLQQGDTLQIVESTNTTWTNYYYFTTNLPNSKESLSNANWLVRMSLSSTQSMSNVVARNLYNVTNPWSTNLLNFSALNFNGTNWILMTNDPTTANMHNYLVNVLLQFYQYQYPLTKVGSNYIFTYYAINLQAARRAP